MPNEREQKLVDLCFEFAMLAATHTTQKSNEQIAEWVATILRELGFPTNPVGMSWGMLERQTEIVIIEILGADGTVHYRRPLGDPLIQQAIQTPGCSIRMVIANA